MIVDKKDMCAVCWAKVIKTFRYVIPLARKAERCQHEVRVHYELFTVVLCAKCGGTQGRCCLCGERRA